MSRTEIEQLQGGTFKRKVKRRVGLFIDGTGLDRATRRLNRKVDLARLVAGVTMGLELEVARYYTLIPYEDDARQFAFLDAVERAGLEVVLKRLPPKGVKRQVSMDVHIATDLLSFAAGAFGGRKPLPETLKSDAVVTAGRPIADENGHSAHNLTLPSEREKDLKRLSVVVCPNRELSYALYICHQLGIETSLADFGLYGSSDGWRGIDRWVDLSTSETIWR